MSFGCLIFCCNKEMFGLIWVIVGCVCVEKRKFFFVEEDV